MIIHQNYPRSMRYGRKVVVIRAIATMIATILQSVLRFLKKSIK